MDELQLDDCLSEAWPKDFSELKELEKLLRCNICKDFMKTAMITGCSHLFCSYCIRQSIQYRNQCPACFVELFDNQLRPERTLDEVVRIFTSVKKKLLKRLQISYAACPAADDVEQKPPKILKQEQDEDQVKQASSVLLFNSPRKHTESPSIAKHRTVPDMFSPRSKLVKTDLFSHKGLNFDTPSSSKAVNPSSTVTKREPGVRAEATVPCPVCSVEIRDKHINLHLDECLARASGAPPKSQPLNKPSRKPLPKLVLTLMKEKELRSYCREYGLNVMGDKKTLITRIQRYTTLYNSECDSLNPRSKQDIIRQVEKEEKSMISNSSVKSLFSQVTRKTDPKIIEEVNTKYLKDNKSEFKKLIENMRARDGANVKRSPRPTINRIVSDEEEDSNPRASSIQPNEPTGRKEFVTSESTDNRILSNDEDNDSRVPNNDEDTSTETSDCIVFTEEPVDRRIFSDDEDSTGQPSACAISCPPSSVLTPKSRESKNETHSENSEKSKQTKKHTPPISPDIQIATSSSVNFAFQPVNSSSPRFEDLPLERPQMSPLISSIPAADNHKPRKTGASKFRATLDKKVKKSSKKLQPRNAFSSSPNISAIDNPELSCVFRGNNYESETTNSPNTTTFISSQNSSRTQGNVQYIATTSSEVEERKATQSPDMFLADVNKESSPPERLQCGSPDLLGHFNASLTPQSQKSHLSQGGHFLFSDSDSDVESKKSMPCKTFTGKEKIPLSYSLSNDCEKNNPPLLSHNQESRGGSSLVDHNRESEARSGCHDNHKALINEDSDDEDFLHLLQNRRRKRKPVVMSPRTTRSKRKKS